jgi:hypothetical protein
MKLVAQAKIQHKAVKLQRDHFKLMDQSQLLKNITINKRESIVLLNKDKDLHRQDQELKSKMPVQKQIFLQLVLQYVKNQYKYATAVNNEYDSIIGFY